LEASIVDGFDHILKFAGGDVFPTNLEVRVGEGHVIEHGGRVLDVFELVSVGRIRVQQSELFQKLV